MLRDDIQPPDGGALDPKALVADLVTEVPGRSRVFEQLGIDYCCGGRVSLADALAARGLDQREVLAQLADTEPGTAPEEKRDWSLAPIDELCSYIVDVHHGYLNDELPRLKLLVAKVARAHGERQPELGEARRVFDRLVYELRAQMDVEERDMFPLLSDAASRAREADGLAELIGEVEGDHHESADALRQLRRLLDDFSVPDGACTSYRAMLDGLEALELDMFRHMHKENNILFPRVMDEAYAAG